jgi:hypothetical protein
MVDYCREAPHRIAALQRHSDGGEENGGAIPFATACGMHFFELGGWSIDSDACTGRCSRDLY